MSTYGEIINNVLLIVPRPELEQLARTKCNQIIQYISKSGQFWKDIEETTIGGAEGVDGAAYLQDIPVTTAVRTMSYVQYPDRKDKIGLLDIKEITTNWEATGDCAYLSGSSLRIKHTYLSDTFKIGYYTSPVAFLTDGSEDALSNWITELAPGLVEDMLAAYLLNLKGDNEDSKRVSELAAVMRSVYIKDFINSVIS